MYHSDVLWNHISFSDILGLILLIYSALCIAFCPHVQVPAMYIINTITYKCLAQNGQIDDNQMKKVFSSNVLHSL